MIWRFGDREIDSGQFEVRSAGVPVPVEPQVLDVLVYLAERCDRVVTKEELLDEVWGDRFVSESTLTSRIKDARRAVGDDGRTQRVIRTVHGRGYRFVPELEELPGGGRTRAGARPAEVHQRAAGPASTAVPTTHYTRSGGYDIAYQVAGDGPPDIVLIPGFVSNLDLQWELPAMSGFFRRLAGLGRLIVFDKRGTGLSERVSSERLPTLEERMDDVRAVMDAAGSERATLFGISEGGPMSLLFAASHPDRVERLVLYGSFTHDPFGGDAESLVGMIRESWGSGASCHVLAPSLSRDAGAADFLARFERLSANPEAASNLVRLAAEIDTRATLPAISAPTLVLHRDGDGIIAPDRGRLLAKRIEGARFVELAGVDHLPFVDADQVLDEVERFLTGAATTVPSDRVLATMLFVDVVGSTETASRMGDAEWRGLLDRMLAVTDRELARFGGTRVNTTGDGLLATLDGPARAVRCGTSLRHALRQLGLDVRCGVHTSEVERRGGDIAGIGVHVGARVGSLAEPGELWVTRTVRDLTAGSGLEFEPRGAHALKGVPGTWELYAAA
ncbi:MAG: alpha/beta fold hydrolase [Acidimicrobiia bacterium]